MAATHRRRLANLRAVPATKFNIPVETAKTWGSISRGTTSQEAFTEGLFIGQYLFSNASTPFNLIAYPLQEAIMPRLYF
jgi:hypothetical protein